MQTRASELWRRLDAVQASIMLTRAKLNKARAMTATWSVVPEHVCEERAKHWAHEAEVLAADLAELKRIRTQLTLRIAIERPHARGTKGQRISRPAREGRSWRTEDFERQAE